MDKIYSHTFANGITIVHKETLHSRVLHCGFILDIGSRDESVHQQGLAHFWEHMAFKGTINRKSFHIINRLESVGGEINAYTTKEKIWFHASVLDIHAERAIELLTDITFRSTFPEKEIEKEKKVIIEEMAMYQDSPEDAIQDDFEELLFRKHPLAHNILGTAKSVESFRQNDFIHFLNQQLDTKKLFFVSVGNIKFAKLVAIAEKHLASINKFKKTVKRKPFVVQPPISKVVKKNIAQAHYLMGKAGYAMRDERRVPLFMLTSLLGGPAMTSWLNMSLRERKGLAYSVEANYTPFTDTGLFTIYFGTEKNQLPKCIELIYKDLKKIREKKLGAIQLQSLKEQLKGQLAIAEENNSSFMQMMGRSMLDLGRIDSLESVLKSIDKITATQLRTVAQEFLYENTFTDLTYIPES